MDNMLFKDPKAIKCELLRDQRRQTRRITFDCFNAHLDIDGEQVFCTKSKKITKNLNGVMPILTCLKGGSTVVCANCESYND
jgi:hypothetical protein